MPVSASPRPKGILTVTGVAGRCFELSGGMVPQCALVDKSLLQSQELGPATVRTYEPYLGVLANAGKAEDVSYLPDETLTESLSSIQLPSAEIH